MVDFRFRAQAWVFGNDIDTDQIVPGQYLTSPVEEQSQHAFEASSPGFAQQFKKGGALVAGSNFGTMSSTVGADRTRPVIFSPSRLSQAGRARLLICSFAAS